MLELLGEGMNASVKKWEIVMVLYQVKLIRLDKKQQQLKHYACSTTV